MAKLEIIGLDHLVKRLEKLEQKTEQPIQFQQQAGGVVLQDVRNALLSGEGFAPHAASTVKRWGAHPVLIGTAEQKKYKKRGGTLLNSIQLRFITNAVDIFTDLYYAKFHHYGEGVPQRVWMKLSAEARALVNKIAKKEFGWN